MGANGMIEHSYEERSILTFEKHIDYVFAISTGLKAPATLATRKARRSRTLASHYVREFETLDVKEKDAFLDALIDLFSGTQTLDQAQKTLKLLGTVGRIGQLLVRIEGQIDRLDQAQRVRYIEEALQISLDRIETLHPLMGQEVLFSKDENFEYLLVSQAIIDEIRRIFTISIKAIGKKKELDNEIASELSLAVFGLLRIEAFRRGKINEGDLSDTLTMLLIDVPSDVFIDGIQLPDW